MTIPFRCTHSKETISLCCGSYRFYSGLFLVTSQGGVERIPQTISEQVEAQHQQADEDGGEENDVRIGEQECLSFPAGRSLSLTEMIFYKTYSAMSLFSSVNIVFCPEQ